MYLLPAIDLLDGMVVRLKKGDYDLMTVYSYDPTEQAKQFEAAGAEWIHVVDLNGARDGEQGNLDLIEDIAKNTNLKIETGGGVRDFDAIDRLRNAGVSRVVLGTSLVTQINFAATCCALAWMRALVKQLLKVGTRKVWMPTNWWAKWAPWVSDTWFTPTFRATACRLASTWQPMNTWRSSLAVPLLRAVA